MNLSFKGLVLRQLLLMLYHVDLPNGRLLPFMTIASSFVFHSIWAIFLEWTTLLPFHIVLQFVLATLLTVYKESVFIHFRSLKVGDITIVIQLIPFKYRRPKFGSISLFIIDMNLIYYGLLYKLSRNCLCPIL